jgi:hypothetical protein
VSDKYETSSRRVRGEVGNALARRCAITRIVGHSLGGGLASAA